jgi:hypothetical protein
MKLRLAINNNNEKFGVTLPLFLNHLEVISRPAICNSPNTAMRSKLKLPESQIAIISL